METIELFDEISEYFISLTKDFNNNDRFVLQIGINIEWILKESDNILFEIVATDEENNGKIVNIFGGEDTTITDILFFTSKLVKKNIVLEKKKKEMFENFEAKKKQLEDEAKLLFNELQQIENSDFDDNLDKNPENDETNLNKEMKVVEDMINK